MYACTGAPGTRPRGDGARAGHFSSALDTHWCRCTVPEARVIRAQAATQAGDSLAIRISRGAACGESLVTSTAGGTPLKEYGPVGPATYCVDIMCKNAIFKCKAATISIDYRA